MSEAAPIREKRDTSRRFRPDYSPTAGDTALAFKLARQDGGFERFEVHPGWLEALRRDSYARNAHSSTSIEGNPLDLETVRRIAQEFEAGGRGAETKHEREIFRHLAYFRALEPKGNLLEGLTIDEILSAHRALLEAVLPDEVVGRLRGPDFPKRVFFGRNEGAPPNEVRPQLDALISWFDGEGQVLPPPVRVAIWFHEFESIHPFLDGNGRVGRALTHRLLVSAGLPYSHLIALDQPFNRDRSSYYRALEDGRDDIGRWVHYFLRCLDETYTTASRLLQRLTSVPVGFKGAQREVLAYVLRSGAKTFRVADIVAALDDYQPVTVSLALRQLADEHRLLAHNGRRGPASAYAPTKQLEELVTLPLAP